jgi:hypothetical protein
VSVNGAELLALIAGSEAVKQAVARGDIRPDKAKLERMIGGAIIEATRRITALADCTSNNDARRIGDRMNERAVNLVKWKWHTLRMKLMRRPRRPINFGGVVSN